MSTIAGHDLENERSGETPPVQTAQFSLRALLLAVGGISILFALVAMLSGVWASIVVWFVLLAVGHVSGAACKKRIDGPRPHQCPWPDAGVRIGQTPPERLFAPRSPLGGEAPIGRRARITTALGGVLGALTGAAMMTFIFGVARVGWAGLLIGTVSLGVVGGFFAFLAGSFLQIGANAWRSARDTADPYMRR